MVSTRVSDPDQRRINHKLDRQKRARRRQSERDLSVPGNDEVQNRIEPCTHKVEDLKRARLVLPNRQAQTVQTSTEQKVLRTLEGIPYWVIENPAEIRELICNHIKKEWEADIAEQENHEGGRWLVSLETRKWRIAEVKLDDIRLSAQTMNFVNASTGYNFRKRLTERVALLNRDLDKFGAVIRPIVLRAEDNQLMDGYCRYHTLKGRGVPKVYAYVGSQ